MRVYFHAPKARVISPSLSHISVSALMRQRSAAGLPEMTVPAQIADTVATTENAPVQRPPRAYGRNCTLVTYADDYGVLCQDYFFEK